ncbi:MAG: putative phage protein (TIGR01671 family) [Oceanospirillaceae bacterium]|jgi:uncharacterized phage protein (TIGR01671 family)
MRQTKFRALNKETKVFVYGDLIKSQMFGREGEKLSSSLINETPLDVEDISTGLGGGRYSFKATFVKVIDETVGQFIGLQDKQGVDIYKGDIVSDKDGLHYIVDIGGYFSKVSVENGANYYQIGDDNYWAIEANPFDKETNFTIIGNIHQNPELIK